MNRLVERPVAPTIWIANDVDRDGRRGDSAAVLFLTREQSGAHLCWAVGGAFICPPAHARSFPARSALATRAASFYGTRRRPFRTAIYRKREELQ